MPKKTRPFSELTKDFSPERKARIAQKTDILRQEMELSEIRQAMELTQATLAENLNVGQAEICKIEKRADMLLSTLGRFIKATGGKLELRAVYPDHTIRIKTLASLEPIKA